MNANLFGIATNRRDTATAATTCRLPAARSLRSSLLSAVFTLTLAMAACGGGGDDIPLAPGVEQAPPMSDAAKSAGAPSSVAAAPAASSPVPAQQCTCVGHADDIMSEPVNK